MQEAFVVTLSPFSLIRSEINGLITELVVMVNTQFGSARLTMNIDSDLGERDYKVEWLATLRGSHTNNEQTHCIALTRREFSGTMELDESLGVITELRTNVLAHRAASYLVVGHHFPDVR